MFSTPLASMGANFNAHRDRVQVVGEGHVVSNVQHAAGFEHGTEADVLLDAETAIADGIVGDVTVVEGHAAGRDVPRPAYQRTDVAVVNGGSVFVRRKAGHGVHLVAVQPVVVNSETAADSRLAVSEYVISESEARRRVRHPILAVRIQRHAVLAVGEGAIGVVAAPRDEGAERLLGRGGSGQRIHGHAGPVGDAVQPAGGVLPRGFGGAVLGHVAPGDVAVYVRLGRLA